MSTLINGVSPILALHKAKHELENISGALILYIFLALPIIYISNSVLSIVIFVFSKEIWPIPSAPKVFTGISHNESKNFLLSKKTINVCISFSLYNFKIVYLHLLISVSFSSCVFRLLQYPDSNDSKAFTNLS